MTARIVTLTIAALGISAAIAVTPASAANGVNGALFGGLAAGAILGGALAANSGPGYAVAPAYDVGACYMTRRPVVNSWGEVVGYRRVRVCD